MPIRPGVTAPRSLPQGFTLLEIMLVLVLIGLMLSTVVPTLRRGDESAGVQTLARTLLAESRKYQQQAMLTGQDMGLQLTEDGYRLVHYQDGRWQAADGDPEPVSSDIRITFKAGESVWQEALLREQQLNIQLNDRVKVTVEPSESAQQTTVAEELDSDDDADEKPIVPDIIFRAAGDVTPGRLELSDRQSPREAQTLVFNENGQINLADEEER